MLVANAFDIAVWSCSNAPGRSAAAERSPHVLSAPPFSLTFSLRGKLLLSDSQLHALFVISAKGSCRR